VSHNSKQDALTLAQAVLSDPAMDQALTWLVESETATPEQRRAFLAWVEADPKHRAAFDKAKAVWDSQLVSDAASQR
jgi:transmembrane sensor